MKSKRRFLPTHQALGIASILLALEDGVYSLERDLKGRWHVWKGPAMQPDEPDHIARQLQEDEVYG